MLLQKFNLIEIIVITKTNVILRNVDMFLKINFVVIKIYFIWS